VIIGRHDSDRETWNLVVVEVENKCEFL